MIKTLIILLVLHPKHEIFELLEKCHDCQLPSTSTGYLLSIMIIVSHTRNGDT